MIARERRPSAGATGKGRALASALTQEQVEAVLDAMFRLLGKAGMERLESSVDRESAQVLKGLLEPHRRKAAPEPTDTKFALRWQEAWARWHDATSDLGDEDGPYVYTEHHWEPPYFDGSAFAERLEEAAAMIAPLIERACALKIEEDEFFREELLAIDEEIGGLPEWMASEECTLGPLATSCFLTWEWRVGAGSGVGPKEVLEGIGTTRQALRHVSLDSDAFVKFFSSLPSPAQKATLQALEKLKDDPSWRQRFAQTYSDWHKVERALLSRHDREAYLRDSLDRLDDEWTFGLPAIEHAVARKDFQQAQDVLTRTIVSLLRSRESGRPWLPEVELIEDRLVFRAEPDQGDIVKLLTLAATVSTGLGDGNRACVFELQKVLYSSSEDWDAVGAAFRKHLVSPIEKQARVLLGKWETLMAQESFGWSTPGKAPHDTWVHELIEAGIGDASAAGSFRTRLTKRLETFDGDLGAFTGVRRIQIIVLVDDLCTVTALKKSHPLLARVARSEASRFGSDRVRKARRAWMKRAGVDPVTPVLLDILKRRGARLVPDPASAHGSRYDEQVAWIQAMREVDADVARRILARWQSAHGRRRNLWAALSRAGTD